MMKIKYFSDTDTAILEFSDHPVSETKEISENLYLDIDKSGNAVNLTIEHARESARFPTIDFEQIDQKSA